MKDDPKAYTTPPSQNALPLDGHPEPDGGTPVSVKAARRVSSPKSHSLAQGIPSPEAETPLQPGQKPPLRLERTSLRKWSFSGAENGVTRALAMKKIAQLAGFGLSGTGAAGMAQAAQSSGPLMLDSAAIWISGIITIGAMSFIFILSIKAP